MAKKRARMLSEVWQDLGENPTPEQLFDFFCLPEYVHFMGRISPVQFGIADCLTLLEEKYYPSNTFANNFLLRASIWAGRQEWSLVSIPRDDFSYMLEIADPLGLQIEKGSPSVFSAPGPNRIHFTSSQIYTLQPVPRIRTLYDDPYYRIILQSDGVPDGRLI